MLVKWYRKPAAKPPWTKKTDLNSNKNQIFLRKPTSQHSELKFSVGK